MSLPSSKPRSAVLKNALGVALNVALLLSALAFFAVMRYPVFKPVLYASAYAHDFGTVAPGSELRHSFAVRNLHPYPVTVTGIKGSCGCTVPFLSRTLPFVLKPLESVAASVQIETPEEKGEFTQQVIVTTAEAKSDTRFRFSATVTE